MNTSPAIKARAFRRPEPSGARPKRLRRPGRDAWLLFTVVAAYLASSAVLPVLAPVSVSDDWVYLRSVEILLEEGRLEVLQASAATALPQVLWGAIVASVLPVNVFGAVRIATILFSVLAALALAGLCGDLGLTPARRRLAVALYLFGPLPFVLSHTFMSDAYFVGFVTLAAFAYLRGVVRDSPYWLLLGGAFSGLALLQRFQGAFLVPSVVVGLLLVWGLPRNLPDVKRIAAAVVFPVLTGFGLALWLATRGPTAGQEGFLDAVASRPLLELTDRALRLLFVTVMWSALFALPPLLGAIGALPGLLGRRPRAVMVGAVLAISGATFLALSGTFMPYGPQFVAAWGLGPNDILPGRPLLSRSFVPWALTSVCQIGAITAWAAFAAGPRKQTPGRSPTALLVSLAAGQFLGALLVSLNPGVGSITYDRYLVPFLPFAVALVLWALRDISLARRTTAVTLVVLAGVAVLGTGDSLRLQRATWALAREANALGVVNTRLDAGLAWDAYHLNELSVRTGMEPRTPAAPFWIVDFAEATDSSYVVALDRLPEFETVRTLTFRQLLPPAQRQIYLLRRPGVTGPP